MKSIHYHTHDGPLYTAWYEYAMQYCDREEYLVHTEHLMAVLRKE